MAKLEWTIGTGPWIYTVDVTINGSAPDMSVSGRRYLWEFYQGSDLIFTRNTDTTAHRNAALDSTGVVQWLFQSDVSVAAGVYSARMFYIDDQSPEHRLPLSPWDHFEVKAAA